MRKLMQMRPTAILCALLLWPMMSHAQSLDEIASTLVAHPSVPAAAVGWVDAADMDFAVAGLQVAGGAAVSRDDAWHLGSITKSMTAVLAARLVEQQTLFWDTRLGSPDGPSLSELLRHTSGLPANPPAMRIAFLSRDWEAEQGEARQMLTRAALGRRSPDLSFLYSNLGYIAAGQMLADAADEEWESLIDAEVFDQLGLTSPGFGAPQRIWGHNEEMEPQEPGPFADNPPAFGPAGGVHMAPRDILAYLHLHLTRDPDYLSEESWDMLHEPLAGAEFAMGWVRRADGSIWHNGSNTFWYAEVVVDHAAGRAAFVAVNSGDLDGVSRPVAMALDAVLTP